MPNYDAEGTKTDSEPSTLSTSSFGSDEYSNDSPTINDGASVQSREATTEAGDNDERGFELDDFLGNQDLFKNQEDFNEKLNAAAEHVGTTEPCKDGETEEVNLENVNVEGTSGVGGFVSNIGASIANVGDGLDDIGQIVENHSEAVGDFGPGFGEYFEDSFAEFGALPEALGAVAGEGLEAIVEVSTDACEMAGSIAGDILSNIGEGINHIGEGIDELGQGDPDGLKSIGEGIGDFTVENIVDVTFELTEGLAEMAYEVAEGAVEVAQEIIEPAIEFGVDTYAEMTAPVEEVQSSDSASEVNEGISPTDSAASSDDVRSRSADVEINHEIDP